MSVQLDHVVPWGRSFDEYRRMFALDSRALAARLLGCGDGPASFNAEATRLRCRVVSCDPIYAVRCALIERRVRDCYETIVGQVKANPEPFVWSYFRNPDELGRCRLAATHEFLIDFQRAKHSGRYIAAALPRLPFADGCFDIALCSHLLFLYSDQLDAAFHCAAVAELARVAGEVRIFPLLALDGRASPHLRTVWRHLAARHYEVHLVRVAYEFQRGGDRMMVVRKRTDS